MHYKTNPAYTDFRGDYGYRIIPKSGMLLLFPGYLKHETFPNEEDTDRIIISFNILTDT